MKRLAQAPLGQRPGQLWRIRESMAPHLPCHNKSSPLGLFSWEQRFQGRKHWVRVCEAESTVDSSERLVSDGCPASFIPGTIQTPGPAKGPLAPSEMSRGQGPWLAPP